jgi:hypothetical protein
MRAALCAQFDRANGLDISGELGSRSAHGWLCFLMKIEFPRDVRDYVKSVFEACNDDVSEQLSLFPAIHEESLDMQLVAQFSKHQRPVRLSSEWLVRIDAHFIGGGRHWGTWEVADIGLMMIFRRRGKVVRSKLALLQSKKLYSKPEPYVEVDPHFYRFGLGRLLQSDAEHADMVTDKILSFDVDSKYQALKKEGEQQNAMDKFQERFAMKMYYLFYNPVEIPHSIKMPLEQMPSLGNNQVGCRVISKNDLDNALISKAKGYSPSYHDLTIFLGEPFRDTAHQAGWRLEYFACDLMMDCKEGMIDDSRNFQSMVALMNQKTRPMSCAISVTFDMPE